jgi:pSer/pThr/pTyr-binding forkhead associated (FHA) protein
MDVKLIVVGAKTGTKEISVKRPKILGRAGTIVIPHAAVSERHCLLFDHKGLLMIQDLNSVQGTHVDGRKIIMAPLPPGAEFSVGPLTFRADYSYSGNLNTLPKTLFLETQLEPVEVPSPAIGETPPTLVSESNPEPATGDMNLPSANVPERTSFFGWGGSGNMPVVAPGTQKTPPEQTIIFPAAHANTKPEDQVSEPGAALPASSLAPIKKTPPPLPPPVSRTVAELNTEDVLTPNFSNFAKEKASDTSASAQNGETESDFSDLAFDVGEPAPTSPQHTLPMKKTTSGSLLDFFSKRPPRRKRVLHGEPAIVDPTTNPVSPPPATSAEQPKSSSTKKGTWDENVPNVADLFESAPPPESASAPHESVDEDLSSFFKKLE